MGEEGPPAGQPSGSGVDGPDRDDASVGGIHAFLIADMRGYTAYTDRYGDEAAARLAERFAILATEVISRHHGHVLELRGDEALAVFTSPRHALRASVALQAALADAPDAEDGLPVGIGLDAGEAVPVQGGFRGAPLNRAARLCSLATGGQVLATPEIVHLAGQLQDIEAVPSGRVTLKGFQQPVDVLSIGPGDPTTREPASRSGMVGLLARFGLGRRRTRVVLGTVAATVLVLTGATIIPSLIPGSAQSSGRDTPPPSPADPPDLLATLIFVPDFSPRSAPAVFMIPDSQGPPPALPKHHLDGPPPIASVGDDAYNRWHVNHGGIPENSQTVRLVLGARTDQPVIITKVTPYVVTRKPPVHGWNFNPETGAGVPLRFVQASLDCPEHAAWLVTTDPKTMVVVDRTTAIDLKVSRRDAEELEVTAFSTESYVQWGLEITYVSHGKLKTLR
ncbi:MAG TPA: adenylate/guanylate cyclase domain-containing protein, partial [Nocardioidaceae bacterium]